MAKVFRVSARYPSFRLHDGFVNAIDEEDARTIFKHYYNPGVIIENVEEIFIFRRL